MNIEETLGNLLLIIIVVCVLLIGLHCIAYAADARYTAACHFNQGKIVKDEANYAHCVRLSDGIEIDAYTGHVL